MCTWGDSSVTCKARISKLVLHISAMYLAKRLDCQGKLIQGIFKVLLIEDRLSLHLDSIKHRESNFNIPSWLTKIPPSKLVVTQALTSATTQVYHTS
jgi:hypothetical protein